MSRLHRVAILLFSAALFSLQAQTTSVAAAGITVTSSANPAVYGAFLSFTVAVAPIATGPVKATAPTGTVTATLPGSYELATATLNATGVAVITIPPTPSPTTFTYGLSAGTDNITFSYSGDSRYAQAQTLFTEFISKANTTTTAAVTGNVQPVHLTATVSIAEPSAGTAGFALPGNSAGSAPSGTVQFFNGTTLLGTAALTPSSLFTSTASLPSAVTPATLTAVYLGDADYNGSTSAISVQTGPGPATLTVISSANPSAFGQPVTLKVAVAAAAAPVATGSVNASLLGLFSLGSVTLDATGQASLTVPQALSVGAGLPWGFPAGSNVISLSYSGDTHYAGAQTTFTQVVSKADTVTTAAIAPGAESATSIIATVSISEASATAIAFALPGFTAGSSSPTGTVQFLSGGTVIGTAPLTSSGLFQSTATLLSSAANVIAVYAGDANYNGSTSPPATQPVIGASATVTVTSNANPATFAEPVAFSVTVTPNVAGGPVPIGVVTATVFGSETLGSAAIDANGHATITVPQAAASTTVQPWGLATGSNAITFTYGGYAGYTTYANAQTLFKETVNKADTSTTVLLAPVASSVNTFTVVATVRIAETSVTNIAFRIPSGGGLSTNPSGNVSFFSGGTLIGSAALTSGSQFQSTAVFTTTPVPSGVQAVYYGDTNYNGSSSPSSSGGAPVTISLNSSANPVVYGAVLTLAATVAPAIPGGPTPTGTLSFYDGSQNLGWLATLDSTGRGTMPIPEPLLTPQVCAPTCPSANQALVLSAGSHSITVHYSGDANYAAVSSAALAPPVSLAQQITQANSTTTMSAVCAVSGIISECFSTATVADAPPPTGGPFHFMVMGAAGLVDGDPSGNVQFFNGTTSLGVASLSPGNALNVASTATLNNTAGTTTAVYSGDANFKGSSSPAPLKASTISLTSNPNPSVAGQSVALTATVTTSATGMVSFLDGSTPLGQVTLAGGTATLTTTFSTAGPHFLSASYSGDSNYLPSNSASYSQTVTPKSGTLGVLTLTTNSTAVYGQQVVFFVSEAGIGAAPPQGAVSLLDGTTVVGGGNFDLGTAEVIVSLPVGTHQLSAVWGGDINWPAAVSPVLSYVVSRAATVTSLGPLSTAAGQVVLTATVSVPLPGAGTPTGTVQFIDATTKAVLATSPLNAGSATASLPSAELSHPTVVAYSGDANFAPSTSAPPAFTVATVAGANASVVAPDEIATIYGSNLANSSAAAAPPLPTSLAGASVTITDNTGTNRAASLYYASPTQINFVVPTGTASGSATLTAAGNSISLSVTPVSPSLFPVAQIVAVHADGTQSIESTAAPIVFGSDSLYLVLYATGLRNRSSLAGVTCTIGSVKLPVTYAGAQSQFPGLDQVVVLLPPSLHGLGTVNVAVIVDGYNTNTIPLTFQ